jgi:cellobionic acid phosphorylase
LNTGTVAWVYRCVIEQLCGLRGYCGDLIVEPKLPTELNGLSGTRVFKVATFEFEILKA